ncbi:histidine-type phosphatase [Dyella flava]|uniref:Histidine-type phosphatase n=1 Tax=Dyella flava TaxID=1920170 RepID=A0ABS2K1M3_9GAMM|nr:histidine-type phosphatase [Dyella flava]MBM7125019.1 histidine-type phosphatase [Dyella flava]GLQ49976.1 phosphoanhydride phosphohydrolase [Dyella flava]
MKICRHWGARSLYIMLIAAMGIFGNAATATPSSDGDLQLVIVLSRHGVRSPTAKPGALDVYASRPWPSWPVAPGYLTPHGKQLMAMMGSWYRAYYADAGLLPAKGCLDQASVYITADDEERTLESARGLLDGFDAHCSLDVHTSPKRGPDALFSHDFSNASDADRSLAAAAVLGRLGDDPARLAAVHASLLADMQAVLLGCTPGGCTAAQTAGKKVLMDQDSSVTSASGDGLIAIKSPMHNASTFAENFFLEYAEGMPMSDVAWGRITAVKLGQLLALHSSYSDISLRTPVLAKAYAGTLASRIAATLQQRAASKPVTGAIGQPGTKFIFLVGHDTNIETLGGLLDLHWMLSEQPVDPTFTGGALVFELRRIAKTGQYVVRAYYVSQSLEQMRHSMPLDLQHSPEQAPIFIPGCSQSTPGYDCPLERFSQLIEHVTSR